MSLLAATIQRLPGFPATVALSAPGRLGRGGIAGAMVFDAGASIHGRDAVARFWAEEGAALDWLDDFLRDPETDQMVRDVAGPEHEDEFEDIQYVKNDLTAAGNDEIY